MRMRREMYLAPPFDAVWMFSPLPFERAPQALQYRAVSYTAIGLLSRWGLIDFVRLERVPGRRRAMRFVQ